MTTSKIQKDKMEGLYLRLADIVEHVLLAPYLLRYMRKIQQIVTALEKIVVLTAGDHAELKNEYTALVNETADNGVSAQTLQHLTALGLVDGLSEQVSREQYRQGRYRDYLLSTTSRNVKKIVWEDEHLVKTMKNSWPSCWNMCPDFG